MISFEKPLCEYEYEDEYEEGSNDPITPGEEMCFIALCDDMQKHPDYYEQKYHELVDRFAKVSSFIENEEIWAKIVEFMESLVEGLD